MNKLAVTMSMKYLVVLIVLLGVTVIALMLIGKATILNNEAGEKLSSILSFG